MKKLNYLFLFMVVGTLISTSAFAQTKELWGTTFAGGANLKGVIFKTDGNGNAFTTSYSFTQNKGISPQGGLIETSNGTLYGVVSMGGQFYGKGVLYSYWPSVSNQAVREQFNSTQYGANPTGRLLEATNGKLYGLCTYGGTNNMGTLYEYTPPGPYNMTKKVDFDGASLGALPYGSLMQASNGKLYGMTYKGGANNKGVLFEYDPSTSTFTKKIDFDGTNGANPRAELFEFANDTLYGMTESGGTIGGGTLFMYIPSTNTLTKKIDFDGPNKGNAPSSTLIKASNGKLYGTTYSGGTSSKGTLFEYVPSTNTLTKKIDFNGSSIGAYPNGSLMEASNGLIFGMTEKGGIYDKGTLFAYYASINQIAKKLDFNGTTNGAYPRGSLIERIICPTITGTDVQSACNTYTWIDGNTYTTSNNTATYTLTNAGGCDSVVTLNLTINSNTGTDVQTACNTFTWIDGNTYTTSNNTATDTLTNVSGCDSVVTLNLTIGTVSSTGTDVQTACNTFTWIDGNTYTTSNNIATDTLTNAVGCDSVVTLNLTINNSNTGMDVQSACNSYTWIDGNTYTTSNNTATDTLTNVAGCDSVVTLNLTINSNTGTDVQTACDSYLWIDGNTYTASNTTAVWTLTNTTGCDSVVTLNLTVNNSNTGTDVQTACNTYTWIDGNTYTTSNNAATYTLTNAVGCDSVVTLNLTINNSNTGTDVQSACSTYSWIDGNTYTASNNVATHTLTNAAGCDSVVTLNLTMTTVDITVSNASPTLTANQTGASYQWIDCNNGNVAIAGETAQSYTATTNGDYAVIVTTGNCSDTSACINITGVGIVENTFGSDIKFYPNPTTDNMTVDLGGLKDVTISIVNVTGKEVYTMNNVTKNKVILPTNNFSKGVYFVTIQSNNQQKIIKLIKQ